MRDIPKPQQIYRHFKGGIYQIVSLAEHTESGEELVVYQAMYGDFRVYARPLALFMGKVDREKYPKASQEYRFEAVQARPEQAQRTEPAPDERDAAPGEQGDSLKAGPERTDEAPSKEEPDIDPLVIRFLDSDSYSEKLDLLAALHDRITDSMINTMAISIDVEVDEGEIEERYEELRKCLLLYDRFECTRLR